MFKKKLIYSVCYKLTALNLVQLLTLTLSFKMIRAIPFKKPTRGDIGK